MLEEHMERREVFGRLQLTGLIAGAQSTFDRVFDRLCDCHLVNGSLQGNVRNPALRGKQNVLNRSFDAKTN